MLGLLTRNLEPGTNMTQMHFFPPCRAVFPQNSWAFILFGPPSDILEGIIRTDPSQVNTFFTHYSRLAKLFKNGILL